jgi:hypothetical protein
MIRVFRRHHDERLGIGLFSAFRPRISYLPLTIPGKWAEPARTGSGLLEIRECNPNVLRPNRDILL